MKKSNRVLIVDDPRIYELHESVIRTLGINVELVKGSSVFSKALETATSQNYDLIFSGIIFANEGNKPRERGAEFLETIVSKVNKNARLFLETDLANHDTIDRLKKQGIEFLPFLHNFYENLVTIYRKMYPQDNQ